MAYERFVFFSVPVVETVAETILIVFARGTRTSFGPSAVAERNESVFPDIVKIVAVDIPLRK